MAVASREVERTAVAAGLALLIGLFAGVPDNGLPNEREALSLTDEELAEAYGRARSRQTDWNSALLLGGAVTLLSFPFTLAIVRYADRHSA